MDAQDRKRFLKLAETRIREGSGSHPSILRERTMAWRAPDLSGWFSGIPFLVVGGLATRLYMPERMTLDVDVLVSPSQASVIECRLKEKKGKKTGAFTSGGTTWRLPDGLVLDVLSLDAPWVDEALAQPVRGDDGLPYAGLPWLTLMKLESGRVQDLADVTRMLGAANEQALEHIRTVIRRWRPQDMEDVNSMVRLGRLEYKRANDAP